MEKLTAFLDEERKNYKENFYTWVGLLTLIESELSEKEKKIFKMRKEENRTLEEVGKEFGVTKERVRQIEAKAEEKLKASKAHHDWLKDHDTRLINTLLDIVGEEIEKKAFISSATLNDIKQILTNLKIK